MRRYQKDIEESFRMLPFKRIGEIALDNKARLKADKYKSDKYKNEEKKTVPVFVKYGLIALAIIVAVIAGVLIYFNIAGSYVATVDGEKIRTGEFKYYLSMYKDNMLTQAKATDPNINETTFWNTIIGGDTAIEYAKKTTLNSLRDMKIQLIKAKENKITLTSSELSAIDKNIQDSIISQMGGTKIKANAQMKSQYGITIDDVRNMQIQVRLVQKYMSAETNKIKVAVSDIKSYYDKNPAWYKSNSTRVNGEEAVWARHILINAAKDATQAVKDTAKKKAEDLLAKIKGGADFVTLAKENSEDTGSAQYGGDYVFGKGQMMPEFEKAAFSLAPGQVYDTLVQTDYGFHIIKLEEKYAKDQPVSLKCATEYRDYGTGFIQYQLYKQKMADIGKDKKFDIVTNTAVYKAIN